jgi:hypothetical protein
MLHHVTLENLIQQRGLKEQTEAEFCRSLRKINNILAVCCVLCPRTCVLECREVIRQQAIRSTESSIQQRNLGLCPREHSDRYQLCNEIGSCGLLNGVVLCVPRSGVRVDASQKLRVLLFIAHTSTKMYVDTCNMLAEANCFVA